MYHQCGIWDINVDFCSDIEHSRCPGHLGFLGSPLVEALPAGGWEPPRNRGCHGPNFAWPLNSKSSWEVTCVNYSFQHWYEWINMDSKRNTTILVATDGVSGSMIVVSGFGLQCFLLSIRGLAAIALEFPCFVPTGLPIICCLSILQHQLLTRDCSAIFLSNIFLKRVTIKFPQHDQPEWWLPSKIPN